MFDVKVMVFLGVLGYLLKKRGLSPAALLIAFIPGPMAEVYLRQGLMMSGGDPSIFKAAHRPAFLSIEYGNGYMDGMAPPIKAHRLGVKKDA